METVLHFFILLNMAALSRAGCSPCRYNLVTGPYGVSDNAFSAVATHSHCSLAGIRFNSSNGWCPGHSGAGHYIQVKLQCVSLLKAIQTKGRGNHRQWATSYSVNISMDGLTWTSLSNSKVFPGNFDDDTIVTNELGGAVIAKYIRVISISAYDRGSMRLEIQGCPYSEINSTCHWWEARLGSAGDVFPVLLDARASNQGICGSKCFRLSQCDCFLFDVTSARCTLLKTAMDMSQHKVDLVGVWYFVRAGIVSPQF